MTHPHGIRFHARLGLSLLMLVVLSACESSDPDPGEPFSATSVLARYQSGEITYRDLDEFLIQQSRHHAWRTAADPRQWLISLLERMATDQILLDEARLVGADQDPEFQALQHAIRRSAYTNVHLQRVVDPQSLTLSEDKLRDYYEAHRDSFQFAEQRRAYNLYLAYDRGNSPSDVRTAMNQLRERIMAGESFSELASAHSHSESRHREGLIGMVEQGHLSEDLDRVVFALQPYTVSEIIATRSGLHLFYVTDVLEAQDNDFEDVRGVIAQRLMPQLMLDQLKAVSESLPQPEPLQFPEDERLTTLINRLAPNQPLMIIGDYQLTKQQFVDELAATQQRLGARVIEDLPQQLLREIRYREIIYQHIQDQPLDAPTQDALVQETSHRLIEHYLKTRLKSYLSQNSELIQTHFDNNRLRFTSPLRLQIARLLVPIGANPVTTMAELEQARSQLDRGESSLSELAESMDGELLESGMMDAGRLQEQDPTAFRFSMTLEPGDHSPPYRINPKALSLIQLVDRIDPQPQPLAMVRDQVVQDYLDQYSSTVYQRFAEQLLAEQGFTPASDARLDQALEALSAP